MTAAGIFLVGLLTTGSAPSPLPDSPVLVELFTSEGCSSCPPADAAMARLAEEQPVPGARIIGIEEHVDYWDDVGWKDPFSSRLFTERQQEYVRRLGTRNVYTPQVVVAGRREALGGDVAAVRSAVAAAAREPRGRISARVVASPPSILDLEVEASWDGSAPADIFVALVQRGASTVVARGENAGRTLEHAGVVRAIHVAGHVAGSGSGRFTGRATSKRVAGADRAVLFVQERGGGPVRAVVELDLPQ